MNAKDLREMTAEQLQEELIKLRKEQFTLRMQHSSGQLGQSHLLKTNQKDIARVKTVLVEKAGN